MILEVAILNVRPGQTGAFEEAFRGAQQFLSNVTGYQRHELRHCVEDPNRYVLLVWWETLESHTKNFRESAGYREWSDRLHSFYDPFPDVEHYVPVSL